LIRSQVRLLLPLLLPELIDLIPRIAKMMFIVDVVEKLLTVQSPTDQKPQVSIVGTQDLQETIL
jgi:hypothetical protein